MWELGFPLSNNRTQYAARHRSGKASYIALRGVYISMEIGACCHRALFLYNHSQEYQLVYVGRRYYVL